MVGRIRTIISEGFFGESARQAISAPAWERGRRRTRQDQISLKACEAGEIADLKIRTERRKSVSSAGPLFKERANSSKNTIQPFDLMSRRHPLSSTRATDCNLLREANRPEGSCDVPASNRRQFS
jgi:hypothetical protein